MPATTHSLESMVLPKNGMLEFYTKSRIRTQKIEDAADDSSEDAVRQAASKKLSVTLSCDTVAPPMRYQRATQSLQLGRTTIDIVDYAEQQSLVGEHPNHSRGNIQRLLNHPYYDIENDCWNHEKIQRDRANITHAYLKTFAIKNVEKGKRFAVLAYIETLLESHNGSCVVSALPKSKLMDFFNSPEVKLEKRERNRTITRRLDQGHSAVTSPTSSRAGSARPSPSTSIDDLHKRGRGYSRSRHAGLVYEGHSPRESTPNSSVEFRPGPSNRQASPDRPVVIPEEREAEQEAIAAATREAEQRQQEAVAAATREAEQRQQEAIAAAARDAEQRQQEAIAAAARDAEQRQKEAVAAAARDAEKRQKEAVAAAARDAEKRQKEAVAAAKRDAASQPTAAAYTLAPTPSSSYVSTAAPRESAPSSSNSQSSAARRQQAIESMPTQELLERAGGSFAAIVGSDEYSLEYRRRLANRTYQFRVVPGSVPSFSGYLYKGPQS